MFSHIDLEHFRITHFKVSDLPAHFRLEMTWEKGAVPERPVTLTAAARNHLDGEFHFSFLGTDEVVFEGFSHHHEAEKQYQRHQEEFNN